MLVALNSRQWLLLSEWVTRSTVDTIHGSAGGMQGRRKRWLVMMNPASRSIRLSETQTGRAMDDVTWIKRQIHNQHAGGFQARVARIFTDTHEAFTGLAIKPRTSYSVAENILTDDIKVVDIVSQPTHLGEADIILHSANVDCTGDDETMSNLVPLPTNAVELEALRRIKGGPTLNDRVQTLISRLISDAQFRNYIEATSDDDTAEGSLSIDNVMAAEKIRDYAKADGNDEVVAGKKLATIVKAMNVVLTRHGLSRKQRSRMLAGEVVEAAD